MSLTLEYLVGRVRLELGDQAIPFETAFIADGVEVQYSIDHFPLKRESIVLTVNGVPFTDWQVDSRHGVFLFDSPPNEGAVINVAGVQFKYFNDEDISVFCDEALREHSMGRLDQYGVQMTLDRVPPSEHHLIAIRAVILSLWALITDASFDIDIQAPDGVSIPRSERYRQLMEVLNARQAEYDALAKALNVGVFRIEVYTLRRVAQRTNRLVPLYMTQEYDDPRPPTRLYPEVSTQGTQFPIEDVPTIDLVMRRDAAFSQTITLNTDLAGLTDHLTAVVMNFPGRTVPRAEFTVTVVTPATGEVRIEMEPDMSKWVPTTAYWQLTTSTDALGGILLAQGKVQAERAISSVSPL